MNTQIRAEIQRLERRLKGAELNIGDGTDLWLKYGKLFYQACGVVAKELGLDVFVFGIMSFGVMDIVENEGSDGAEIILLCNSDTDAANFNRQYSKPITKILRSVTKDASTLSYYGYPDDKGEDSN